VIRLSVGAIGLSPLHSFQTGSGAHLTSCTMGAGSSFSEVERPGREADRSSKYSDEVKNGGAISPLPNTSS
jgi:hypothetical protein